MSHKSFSGTKPSALLAFIAPLVLNACTHQMSVPVAAVATMPGQFQNTSLQKVSATLVIPPTTENYVFTKKAYNWAGGSLFPDTIHFDLGRTLTEEFSMMCKLSFQSCNERRGGASSTVQSTGDYVLTPTIQGAKIDLPVFRFGTVDAEVEVELAIQKGSSPTPQTIRIIGKGGKQLQFTRDAYLEALRLAVKDLMLKARDTLVNSQ